MAAGESVPPAAPSEQAPAGPRKTLVLVLVAILVVAALAGVTYVLVSRQQPPTTPPAIVLDHVTITGGTSVDQAGSLTLNAAAIDTKGVDEAANAQWVWTANPVAAVDITTLGSPSSVRIFAKQAGSVTITANATWNNSAKGTSQTVTVNALSYELTPGEIAPLVGTDFTLTVRVLRGTTLVTSYQGTVHFTSDDTSATLPADYAFTLPDAGAHLFSTFRVSRGGSVTISAADTRAAISGSTTVSGNRAPTAVIAINPNAANPLIIEANASQSSDPDNNPLTYAWEFGDGATSSERIAMHTYARAGTYLVNLTVTDSHAVSDSAQQSYLAKSPPTASFTFSLAAAGQDIRMSVDASNSNDADGTIVNYNWTWGDGNFSDVTTAQTTHDYAPFWHDKDLTVVLRVTDNDNLNGTASETVRITLQNLRPIACFVVGQPIDQINRTVDVDAACSTDPNGEIDIAWYNWTWGDGKWDNVTIATASHKYLTDGTFVTNLTVGDRGNLKGYVEHPVMILQPPVPPDAVLVVTRDLMHVDADASQSFDANGDIASYTFNWGDGMVTGPQASAFAGHDYAAANSYTITLTVTDAGGRAGADTQTVSVAQSTLDYQYYDFFNVPFGEWWDMRYNAYGDLPINADCFNRTSTTDRIGTKFVCAASPTNGIKDYETYPYTNWYPLPGQIRPGNPTNNPLVYAPYRFLVQGVNVPGYNRSEPVFLPVFNYNAQPGNQLDFRWYMQYFDVATANTVTGRGCSGVAPSSNDGFQIRSQVWLTMDLQESKRIFGVPLGSNPTQAQTWWNQNTNNACGTQAVLENSVQSWFETLGGPAGTLGKYDIVNAFEYQYTPFYTNITAIVESDGTTRVYLEHAAWGTEVLLSRMFYWGNASYKDYYLDSRKAVGWWGMENAWFEDFNFQGSLGPPNGGFDFTLSSVMQYHFVLRSLPGPDGRWDRVGDVPYWFWGPILTDYTNDYSPKHLLSELDRYPSPFYGYIHTTPGSARYNQNLSYDYVPITWNLKPGQTWHFGFPTGNVLFYDPITTPLGSDPRTGAYREIRKTLAYDTTVPVGLGTWDDTKKTWDVYGPTNTGGPSGNAGTDGTPGTSDDQYPLRPYGALQLVPGVQLASLATPSFASASNGFAVDASGASAISVGTVGLRIDLAVAPSAAAPSRSRWE